MSNLPPPPPPPPPSGRGTNGDSSGPNGRPPNGRQGGGRPTPGAPGGGGPGLPRWSVWILLGVVLLLAFGLRLLPSSTGTRIDYSVFRQKVIDKQVAEAQYNNDSGD